jgi:hypothetical protein
MFATALDTEQAVLTAGYLEQTVYDVALCLVARHKHCQFDKLLRPTQKFIPGPYSRLAMTAVVQCFVQSPYGIQAALSRSQGTLGYSQL